MPVPAKAACNWKSQAALWFNPRSGKMAQRLSSLRMLVSDSNFDLAILNLLLSGTG